MEPGCGGKEKHVSDLTGGGQPRGGSGGVAQPNPGQQSHCRGTWGDLLLRVPAVAGVSVLFPGGERGGEAQANMVSPRPLFPSSLFPLLSSQ